MPKLVDALGLKGNPFEHYVAETEPDIAEYAVKPPYFETIEARANSKSSYVLFGDRGAGKSATRLTVFKQLWANREKKDQKVPLAVNVTDFSAVVQGKKLQGVSEATLIKEVAFVVIESLLAWLSSLEEGERSVFLEAMTDNESSLCYSLLRDYYIARSEAKRTKSAREAMALFNQAFLARNRMWAERRWDAIAGIFGRIVDALSRKYLDVKGVGAEAKTLVTREREDVDSVLLLRRLVDLAQVFAFSGVVVLIDKVDETEATSNSADQTAALIHPLLSRVQLMEIKDFSWIFFLWDRVKAVFESQEYPVRLDKIGHATVSWDDDFFAPMLDKRVRFFSDGRSGFSGLFSPDADVSKLCGELVRIAMRSPRELIRLMDVIVREHDISSAMRAEVVLLSSDSVELGIDKYVKDVVSTVYGERLLGQIFRLNKSIFTNKDVQQTFRVGAQSARTRIQSWENAGIIRLTGTQAAEGARGRPVYQYTIVDSRVERAMRRQLFTYSEPVVEEPDFELE